MSLVEVGARLVVQERARYVRELEAGRDANQKFGGSTERAGRQARDAGRGFDEAGSKARGMGGAVAAAGRGLGRGIATITGLAATASAAAGAVGIRTAAQLETAEIGFTTMLGSAEKADAFLGDLAAFASSTPFAFPELQTAASSLVSAGIEASKVIPIMTSLGNATSGMGTGAEGVKRATVALQQMNAAGKITGEDLNQLRDAGIPVYDLLAAATGKSKEAVAELASKGKLGRQELEQLMGALESGKGLERFTGLMEAQSQSLTGLWSTLQDTFSMGMAEAIQPAIPLIKDGLGGAITMTAELMPHISSGLQTVVQGASDLAATGGGVKQFAADIGELGVAGAASKALDELVSPDVMAMLQAGRDALGAVGTALRDDVGPAAASAAPSVETVTEVLRWIADNGEKVAVVAAGGAAAFLLFKGAAGPIAATRAGLEGLRFATASANAVTAIANLLTARQIKSMGGLSAAQARATVTTGALTATTATGAVATGGAAGAVKAFGLALHTALGPVGWVIIGVTALTAGLVYAYKHSETFRDLVNGAFREVGKGAIAMVDGVLGGIQWMMEGLGKLPGPLGAPFRAAAGQIETARGKLDDLSDKLDGFGRKRANATIGIVGTAAAEAELIRLEKRITSIGGVQVAVPAPVVSSSSSAGGLRAYARGGPVTGREPVIVGDGGRPEMFIPSGAGYIAPTIDAGIARLLRPAGSATALAPSPARQDVPELEIAGVSIEGGLHLHLPNVRDLDHDGINKLTDEIVDELDRRYGRR